MRYRMKRLLAGLLSAVMLLSLLPAMAWAAGDFPGSLGGTGDADNPYQISTAEQLAQLSEYVNAGNNCQNKHFKLMGDIDLKGGPDNLWTPIGNVDHKFQGSFDGGSHTISGLYIDSFDYNLGLFGYIDGGTVKNLGVSGYIKVHGSNYAGGIVGYNTGPVSDCYNIGSISGAARAGGIVGHNSGDISDCYNAGAVSGTNCAGGIVGDDTGHTFKNCYNVGQVTGTGSRGGIAGAGSSGHSTYENCYFLADTAEKGVGNDTGNTTGVEQKSEDEFKSLASTLGAGWTDDPFLGRPVLTANKEPWPISGEGTDEHPFEIPDKETLEKVRNYINSSTDGGEGKTFKLTANIDLKGEEWTPIGGGDNPFQGTFDGGGFTVRGLYIRGYGQYCGLFGYIGENGAVYDLTVEGEVSGFEDIGGIAGKCDGRIEKCVNAATVTGQVGTVGGIVGEAGSSASVQECVNRGRVTGFSSYIGGIVGKISGDVTIDGCGNTGKISGQTSVGGIAGGADSVRSAAVIKNCDNAGEVRGDGIKTGGVIGLNDANCTVTDCRSSGSVFGMNTVGGVVGENDNGTIKNCYNTGEIAGRAYIGGVVGENDNGTVENCYNIASVTGESGMVGGVVGSGSCMNSYYLDTCCADGEAGTKKTANQFASGEVAYLLQNGQDPQVWGQTVGSGTPELTNSEDKKVFKITGKVEDQADVVWYSNRAATLPTTEPTKAGFAFAGWSTEEARTEADFVKGFTVSGDMTVYAVWKVPFEGSGTAEDPYCISDKEELKAFRDYVNSGKGSGEYFKLTGNVDLNDEPWTPIGSSNNPFQGTFDGDGHTISGLYIDQPSSRRVGLFGETGNSATVKNLTVAGTVTGSSGVAGIVGDNSGTVENCHNLCNVNVTSEIGGGVVGMNIGGGKVTNCYNSGDISGPNRIGGITGASLSSTVANCYNTGKVTGTGDYIGGIVGENVHSTVTNCYYLDTSCDTAGGGTAKNEAEFNSGEVAWLLQGEQGDQVWGQAVGGGCPELTGDAEKKVYQVTFLADLTPKYEKKLYANPGGTLPEAETLKPEKDGYTFVKWAQTDSPEGEAFTASTQVNSDLTLYAIFEEKATEPTEPEDSGDPGTSSEPTEPDPSKGPETSEGPQNPTSGPSGGGSGDHPSGTPDDAPKTGDESQLSLWLALTILSLAGAGVTAWMPIMGRKRPAGMRKANERK